MMVTDFRCWWQNHYVGDLFRYLRDFLNVFNRSPTSQTCHQDILSLTSVTNIDVTVLSRRIPYRFWSVDSWKEKWKISWVETKSKMKSLKKSLFLIDSKDVQYSEFNIIQYQIRSWFIYFKCFVKGTNHKHWISVNFGTLL